MSEAPHNLARKSMDDLVALCRRRGFIWQSSEIYGGINGFWDYGPLGAELKKNLKDAWWHDILRRPMRGPDGRLIEMVAVDCTIIMNPEVWVASGHVGGFADPMVDDRETKQRFRADHLYGLFVCPRRGPDDSLQELWQHIQQNQPMPVRTVIASSPHEALDIAREDRKIVAPYRLGETVSSVAGGSVWSSVVNIIGQNREEFIGAFHQVNPASERVAQLPSPFTGKTGTLTPPRMFNLMFETYIGAVRDEESKSYLRPETAQGIFTQFWNVVDTSRVKVPFGIAQVGKAFRNEVTPRNFTYRSREFEQMEIEFFIPDPEVVGEEVARTRDWYAWWRDARYEWWKSLGLAGENLQLREHEKDELAHYAKEGAGVSDIEYRFPFTAPGFGELEGVAHRSNFDLRQHAQHCGKGDKMRYFDQERNTRYFPHVIEPSAGADRGALAILCEAYTPDPSRPSGVVMKFHPRLAPIKAAIFPLVNKDGMPEVAEKLYLDLREKYAVDFDVKQTIGKRYARMDEAGTPYCFTIDGDTLRDGTVTVRDRDTAAQERINIEQVEAFLAQRLGG